ncbi:hypothetical protein EV130_12039 [Rhizobium azibense]|uniref:Uncharacterized protein n=1 Tax=Rhizobium azibense TaxID=1136135 RepID=A0A4V2V939_9HYPH|nr:hypothetical protein EV130_12039 [Rhizobium azibense]
MQGEAEVPALVVDANAEDCLVASLVEDCSTDLLHDIGAMKGRGYGVPEIASKIGLSPDYVYGVVRLIENDNQFLRSNVLLLQKRQGSALYGRPLRRCASAGGSTLTGECYIDYIRKYFKRPAA